MGKKEELQKYLDVAVPHWKRESQWQEKHTTKGSDGVLHQRATEREILVAKQQGEEEKTERYGGSKRGHVSPHHTLQEQEQKKGKKTT